MKERAPETGGTRAGGGGLPLWALILSALSPVLMAGGPAPVEAAPRPPQIRELKLLGCENLSPRRLRAVMRTRPGFRRRPLYRPRGLASDLDAILAIYASEGYLDASIAERLVTVSEDGRTASIQVTVDEGPRTRVGELSVTGAEQITVDEIRGQLRVTEGDPFRQRHLLSDRVRLQRLYSERGMIDTRIGYRAVVDSPTVASVSYQIAEGPPVRVREILLEGLGKTRPHIVRRELKLWPGDLFRHSAMERSQTSLFSTGLFRSVLVEPAPNDGSDPRRRDLRVAVRERQTGSFDAGVGYGSSERIRVTASVGQTNWQGRALRIGVNTRASRLVRRAEAAFTNPRLLSNPFALDWRSGYEWERNPVAEFRTQRVFTESVLSYTLRNSWVGEVLYQLEQVELFEEDTRTERPTRVTSLLGVGTRRDSRDNALDSRAGSLLQARFEYAGGLLRGDNDFRRTTAEAIHFRPWGRTVLAAHVGVSHIAASDTAEVVEYERFYLGGDRSVRGYARGEIGAERVGHVAFSSQLEARLPLGSSVWVLFLDSGQVWPRLGDAEVGDLRLGYGSGMRFVTRFGLLRLDVALADESGSLGERLGLYVGVGQAF